MNVGLRIPRQTWLYQRSTVTVTKLYMQLAYFTLNQRIVLLYMDT